MTYRYFAYGSSLDPLHFAEWCDEHGYQGRALEDGQLAVLDDWELALTVPSRFWLGGVGTIEPKQGATTWGLLFTLPDEWADMIRHKEGVASGLYREIDVEVRLWTPGADQEAATIQLLSASAFRVVEEHMTHPAPHPSRRWLDIVIRGAEARGMPDLWIADLRRRGR